MPPDVQTRIDSFKTDLRTKPTPYMIRKYTTFGEAFIVERDKYFDLRSDISDHFLIHPSEVLMVGSGKLGFSIKPSKRYIPFGEESDIDMAIVSPDLFDRVWKQSLEYSLSGALWGRESSDIFKKYLFRGWIRPDKLPVTPEFKETQDWWEYFNLLTNLHGIAKITGGLYRSWYHFELYQSRAIVGCKQDMELADG